MSGSWGVGVPLSAAMRSSEDATERLDASELGSSGVRARLDVASPRRFEPEIGAGALVGRYRVREVVGRGGMGVVYAAHDPHLKRDVAIKLLRPSGEDTRPGEARERLLREAQALAAVSHPNIVPIYDVGRDQGHVFLAMKWLEGQTLVAWSREKPRSWRAVLAVYRQAAAGLAAAHDAGIVHRDFKPANAIVDACGHVSVFDFGLAAALDDVSVEGGSFSTWTDDPDAAPIRLTQTGVVMGTPAYMAPEQGRGAPVDARCDVYAFCVSMYEALYGHRPFAGDSRADLERAKARFDLVEPSKPDRVPRWLRNVLVRGLEPAPQARWESMGALLSALQRGPTRVRVPFLLFGSLATSALILGSWSEESEPCSSSALLEPVWNPSVASALVDHRGVNSSGELLQSRIDAYVGRWKKVHRETCEGRSEAEAVADSVSACLRERLHGLDVFVTEAQGEARAPLADLADAVLRLPSPETCLRERERWRGAPRNEALLHRARKAMARVRALVSAGNLLGARDSAKVALELATRSGFEPAIAEAMLLRADVATELGRFREGLDDASAAAHLGQAVHDDALVARAAALAAHVSGAQMRRQDDAEHWVRTAEAALARSGRQPMTEASLALTRSRIAADAERWDDAHRHALELMALAEEIDGASGPEVAKALENLASVAVDQGELDQAKVHLERALEIQEAERGSEHPALIAPLNNLGRVHLKKRELGRARELHERALALAESSLGSQNDAVAYARSNLGAIAYYERRLEDAREHYEAVLEIFTRTKGEEHPDVSQMLNNLGLVAQKTGELEAAISYFDRAVISLEAAGASSHDIAITRMNLGRTEIEAGRVDEGIDELGRAARVAAASGAYGRMTAAICQLRIAQAYSSSSRLEDGVRAGLEAVTMMDGEVEALPDEKAELLYEVGRVLHESGRRQAALGLFRRAADLVTRTDIAAAIERARREAGER